MTPPNILASLLGGINPQGLMENFTNFMSETRNTLKSIENRLANIEKEISNDRYKRAG